MKSTIALVLALTAFVACTSTTKGEGPSSSSSSTSSTSSGGSSSGITSSSTSSTGGSVSTAQCQSTCISKVYQCNADPPSTVSEDCNALCSQGSYRQDQLDCFRNTPCESFRNAAYIEDVCP